MLKKKYLAILHPNEFLAVFQKDNTTLNTSFSHEEEIGRYEWSSADELAQMPPREEKAKVKKMKQNHHLYT